MIHFTKEEMGAYRPPLLEPTQYSRAKKGSEVCCLASQGGPGCGSWEGGRLACPFQAHLTCKMGTGTRPISWGDLQHSVRSGPGLS